ncbi:hypothetical protein JXM83_06980 [Candidatus Woesearchaeota archaeon]|nr:hypothetical protein [Candidatus Woesearchaeota archaeon]
MKRILGFTGGVIATSILFSGCAGTNVQTIEKQPEVQEIKNDKPFLRTVDGDTKKIIPLSEVNVKLMAGLRVAIHDEDIQIQPSLFRNENCTFLGETKLNGSTERFEVRLKNAICTDENNITYESNNIRGYVIGEDNIVGIRGVLVLDVNREGVKKNNLTLTLLEQLNNVEGVQSIRHNLLKQITTSVIQLTPGTKTKLLIQEGDFVKVDGK